jgi:hypothetical protein
MSTGVLVYKIFQIRVNGKKDYPFFSGGKIRQWVVGYSCKKCLLWLSADKIVIV